MTTPAPTLVLLHPVGLNGGAFAFLDLPARGIRGAVAPNLLGHGGRSRSPGMTMADVADDVAAAVEGPLDLAGFSFGGMVALHLALRHPGRVRSLFVACGPAVSDPDVMVARAEAAEAGMEGMVGSTLERWFTPAALADEKRLAVSYSRSTLLALDPYAFADCWRAIAGHDVVSRLGEIDVPVTALAGRQDVSSPPEVVRVIADGIGNARYVEIDGPHMAFLEEPAAVAGVLADHLARARAGA